MAYSIGKTEFENVTQRGNSLQIRTRATDNTGKSVRKSKSIPIPTGTETERKKALRLAITEFEQELEELKNIPLNSPIPVSSIMTFAELTEKWFQEVAQPNHRKSTLARELKFKTRVNQAFGDKPINEVTPADIRVFLNFLAFEEINSRTKQKGMSKKTIELYLSYISTIFQFAVDDEALDRNPCRNKTVRVPEKSYKPPKPKMYEVDEMKQLLSLLENSPNVPLKYFVIFSLAAFGGIRRGEIMGLTYDSIDFKERLIDVNKAYYSITNTAELAEYCPDNSGFSEVKTETSERYVKLPQKVIDLIKRYRKEQQAEREQLGDLWKGTDGRLFTTWDGLPMHTNTPYNFLKKFCTTNDLPFCNVHSFRHFHISYLIREGIDPVTVSKRAGHTSVAFTMQQYAKEFAEYNARCSDVVEKALESL